MSSFMACKSADNSTTAIETDQSTELVSTSSDVILGAEQIISYLPHLKNKRVGMVVNQTSVINGIHLVDTLQKLGVDIAKVFAPEHGFRGDHSDGAIIKNGIDEKTGLPVISLYGKNKKPSVEMFNDLDVIIFDIQDVGVRFYTFISTMHYVMETAAEMHKHVIVLDRPNPNGFYIDGPVLDSKYKSFVGMHQIPIVHGLTVAELALMINGESWLKGNVVCNLTVIPCKNYTHQTLYELPIKPSPNLPNMNSVYLYPFLGLFEGTNVSIGRGTDKPFQIVGRPGFEGSHNFTPKSIPGVSENPKYKGQECSGEIVTDVLDSSFFQNPGLKLDLLLLFYSKNRLVDGPYFREIFYKLSGNSTLKSQIESGLTESEIRQSWKEDLDKYKERRKYYLLYP
jgi:uncharacterized protein YbbC (DUF1343 family)